VKKYRFKMEALGGSDRKKLAVGQLFLAIVSRAKQFCDRIFRGTRAVYSSDWTRTLERLQVCGIAPRQSKSQEGRVRITSRASRCCPRGWGARANASLVECMAVYLALAAPPCSAQPNLRRPHLTTSDLAVGAGTAWTTHSVARLSYQACRVRASQYCRASIHEM
jgi:hypothetical protein